MGFDFSKGWLGKEIDNTVESVYCQVSGRELPATSSGITHLSLHEENASGSSKKQTFTTMNTNETNEPANYVHMNTPNIVHQTIGTSHGNEQTHFDTPATAPHMVPSATPPHMITLGPGAGHAINSMNAPWNAKHFKC